MDTTDDFQLVFLLLFNTTELQTFNSVKLWSGLPCLLKGLDDVDHELTKDKEQLCNRYPDTRVLLDSKKTRGKGFPMG